MECKCIGCIGKASVCNGINRYIMECKLDKIGNVKAKAEELIDTLWNVNYFCAGDSISATLN